MSYMVGNPKDRFSGVVAHILSVSISCFSPKCKHMVTLESGYQCVNTECTQGALSMFNTTGEVSVGEPEKEFSLPTSIADHTGSISQCRLNAVVIENMLGWNVSGQM